MNRLNRLFSQLVGDRAHVSVQNPIRLGAHSEPQVDLTVLRPRQDFYAPSHPASEDVLLVVEVAETSADTDREVKLPLLYTRAGIGEVWLVGLATDRGEVYWKPASHGYHECRIVGRGQRLAPQALPDLDCSVETMLG